MSSHPPKQYLKLVKTLYGLKRLPRHWYDLASRLFTNLGLEVCPNAPCLFSGSISGSKERIYVGLYVDDFIYFGDSPSIERLFESKLASSTLVTFNHKPSLFLGLKQEKPT